MTHGTHRMRIVALATMTVAGLVLSGCAPAGSVEDNANNEVVTDGTFSVGFISPLTGPVAIAGQEMLEGWELYWDVNGDSVAGVTVETVVEDDAGNPEISLTKAKKLVESDGVDVIVGPLLANTALAVAAYTAEAGVPNLHPVSSADDLTQRQGNALTMRVGSMGGSQMNFPAGDWAYDQGHRTAVTLCPDYAFGWDSCAGFVRTFTEAGGEVTDQFWFPLGTQDFSTYVSQLQGVDADVAFITTAGGADGPNLLKTFNEFGLKDQLPVVTNCCALDQATLRTLGAEVEGFTSVSYYAEGRDSAVVEEFVAAYGEAHEGKIPSLSVAGGWMTAMVIAQVLEENGGAVSGEEFIEAARSLTFDDSLYGPVSFDEFNNLVAPVYVREVQLVDGAYRNVPIDTYEAVSQFWTFDPDEYLSGPTYSRTDQGR